MRRKRREERMLFSFMLLIILVLLTVIGVGAVFLFASQSGHSCVGTWKAELSYADEVQQKVGLWMHEAEGLKSDEGVVYMEQAVIAPVQLEMILNKDGSFYIKMAEDSFRQCEESAYAYAASYLTATIADKLKDAGYEGMDLYADAESVAEETVGGDISGYLKEVMPQLLPDQDTISMAYEGTGSYVYDKKAQTIEFTDTSGKIFTERIVMNKNQMVFTAHEGETEKQYDERNYPLVWEKE